jgi:hypothetical protein
MRYALIKDGVIANIAHWDGNEHLPAEGEEPRLPFSQLAWPGMDAVKIPEGAVAGIGDAFDGGFPTTEPDHAEAAIPAADSR